MAIERKTAPSDYITNMYTRSNNVTQKSIDHENRMQITTFTMRSDTTNGRPSYNSCILTFFVSKTYYENLELESQNTVERLCSVKAVDLDIYHDSLNTYRWYVNARKNRRYRAALSEVGERMKVINVRLTNRRRRR
jgi:hypothetical protein